jgi:hypothetical protein
MKLSVVFKGSIFWDIMPWKPVKSQMTFWRIVGLLFMLPAWSWLHAGLTLRWRRYFPPKCPFTQYLHGVTSQKTAFFNITHRLKFMFSRICFVILKLHRVLLDFFFLWRYSSNLGLGLPPWNSPFHFSFLDLRHSVGLLGRVISSSQGLYLGASWY